MTPESIRIAFMGTPDFAVHILEGLVKAKYNVVAVYTQPPRPMGRGYKMNPTPVEEYARLHNIPVYAPSSLKSKEAQTQWKALNLDVAIVAAYGLILPQAILDAPRWGCLNIHASLLPRWRGAAPIQRAILADDRQTGITIMKMEAGLDTGNSLLMESTPITSTTTTVQLHQTLATLGSKALLKVLPFYLSGEIEPIPQPEEGVTYAEKLLKKEGELNWQLSAKLLERKIRALNPWPGTWFMIGEDRIKVLDAMVVPCSSSVSPGTIVDDQLTIACGEGALRILLVQKTGKNPMPVEDFLRGYQLPSKHLSHASL